MTIDDVASDLHKFLWTPQKCLSQTIQMVTNESHQASNASEMDTGREQESQILYFFTMYWNVRLGLSK